MPVSPSQLSKNIEPGSLPFGQRQALSKNLPQATPGPQGPAVPGPAGGAGASLGIPGNPLDFLAGGRVKPNGDELTSGLSVGPGAGPTVDDIPDRRVERLRAVALQAKSPVLRELARRGLNQSVREKRLGN